MFLDESCHNRHCSYRVNHTSDTYHCDDATTCRCRDTGTIVTYNSTSTDYKKPREDGCVYDSNGTLISPLHDDYDYWKTEQENSANPLSDDYCKYDHE